MHDNFNTDTAVWDFLGSCNLMGNTDTLKITKGKDKIK